MIIGIDMGHSEWNKSPCGAIGFLNESKENRKVGELLINKLRGLGHTVINCSCNSSTSVNSQLQAIVNNANKQKLDLFLSLHLNAGGGTGTEIYTTKTDLEAIDKAKILINTYCNSTGYRNRGLKNVDYYVLTNTYAPAMLIELCFVDNVNDYNLWNSLGVEVIASALCKGLTGSNGVVINKEEPIITNAGYTVKITADTLNVRSGAGVDFKITTSVKKNQVYTIVQENNGWGKLKSGAGWINLSYTTKTSSGIAQNGTIIPPVKVETKPITNTTEYAENGIAKVLTTLNIRNNPNGTVVGTYYVGETFTYNYVKIINDQIWVRYTSYSGLIRWVCVKENGIRYANCY